MDVYKGPWRATWKVTVTFPLKSEPQRALCKFRLLATQIDLDPLVQSEDPSVVEQLSIGNTDRFIDGMNIDTIENQLKEIFSELYCDADRVISKLITGEATSQ